MDFLASHFSTAPERPCFRSHPTQQRVRSPFDGIQYATPKKAAEELFTITSLGFYLPIFGNCTSMGELRSCDADMSTSWQLSHTKDLCIPNFVRTSTSLSLSKKSGWNLLSLSFVCIIGTLNFMDIGKDQPDFGWLALEEVRMSSLSLWSKESAGPWAESHGAFQLELGVAPVIIHEHVVFILIYNG